MAQIGIAELSAELISKHNLTKSQSKEIVDDLRDSIVKHLMAGDKVALYGLGTFEVKATAPRVGRNPQTGESIPIPAGKKISFKVAKAAKATLQA